jgi:hypothetical protein
MIPPSEKGVLRGIVPPEREGVNLNSLAFTEIGFRIRQQKDPRPEECFTAAEKRVETQT